MALTSGPNLGLLINGNLGESHYTELMRFLRGVDGLVMLSVKDKDLSAPLGTAVDGDRYLVAANPTGAWAGKEGHIARFTGTQWEFFAPHEGWLTHVDDEKTFYRHTADGWVKHIGPASTGWSAPTGTATRAAFDTATVTLPQLAEHVKALIDDLVAQGRLTP